jgi:hypothetical protein
MRDNNFIEIRKASLNKKFPLFSSIFFPSIMGLKNTSIRIGTRSGSGSGLTKRPRARIEKIFDSGSRSGFNARPAYEFNESGLETMLS